MLKLNVQAGYDTCCDVDLQRQPRAAQGPPKMLVDYDDIGRRVIHLDDLMRVVGLVRLGHWPKLVGSGLSAVPRLD